MFTKLGLINEDNTVSITNTVVIVFVLITAFRSVFSGLDVSLMNFHWKVESLDMSSTLPLLFSLMNYGHKRMINSQTNKETV